MQDRLFNDQVSIWLERMRIRDQLAVTHSHALRVQRYYMDDSKLKGLGWSAQVSWEEGLKVRER